MLCFALLCFGKKQFLQNGAIGMKTEKLKSLYENMPKGIKKLFSPLFVKAMIRNPAFKSTYDGLVSFENKSLEEQKEIQFQKLKEKCVYAFNHTEYYRELFNGAGLDPGSLTCFEDLSSLPLTDKYIAQEQGSRLYSDENIPCYEGHTSGSTGKVFKVLLDKESVYKERAVVCRYMEKFGYDIKRTRTLAFWGHNKDADYYYSPLKNEIVISPFRLFKGNEFDDIWRTIERFKPEVVAGYPSAISVLCDSLKRANKKLGLKFVLFYGESSTDYDRKQVEEALGCPCITYYGHTERCAFLEKYEDGYKINGFYGYTELVPTEEHNVFRIVSTGFLSNKMPLIRYATDDYVVFDDRGRMDVRGHTYSEQKVIASNGAQIYKGTISPHSGPFEKVRFYQYIQDKPGHVYLDAVMDAPFTDDDLKELAKYFERKCEGLLDVDIRQVKELRANKRGKYVWLIDEIDYSEYPELKS